MSGSSIIAKISMSLGIMSMYPDLTNRGKIVALSWPKIVSV